MKVIRLRVLFIGISFVLAATGCLTPATPISTSHSTDLPATATPALLMPETSKLIFTSLEVVENPADSTRPAAIIKGNQPESCTELSGNFYWREPNQVELGLLGQHPSGSICAQVITPFTYELRLDFSGKPAGSYEIRLGELKRVYELKTSNATPQGQSGCPPRLPGTNLYESRNKEQAVSYCFLYPYEFGEVTSNDGSLVTFSGPTRSFSSGSIRAIVKIATVKLQPGQSVAEMAAKQLTEQKARNVKPFESKPFANQSTPVVMDYQIKDQKLRTIWFEAGGLLFSFTLSPQDVPSLQLKNDLASIVDLINLSFTTLH